MIAQGSIKVACQQLAPHIGDLEYNRALGAEAIRQAAATGRACTPTPIE